MKQGTEHFLDVPYYDWARAEAVELHQVLVRAYGTKARAEFIAARSGVPREEVNFEQPPRGFWQQILETAAASRRARKLTELAREDRSIAGYHPRLARLLGQAPSPVEAPARPRPPSPWPGAEVITGRQETFLEMSFLHEGLRVAPSVVRLGTLTRGDESFCGSGLLIAEDTILTNHHVLHDADGIRVKQVDIWFNYERDAQGRPRVVDSYEGETGTIAGDAEHDWAIVRSRKPIDSSYPVLSLRPSKPVRKGDFVYIIQHPEGRTKKLGMLHNEVVGVTPDRVQYLTDTLPGSSGSPVFNELWQVVALHHEGIKGDGSPGSLCRNQGIQVERVLEGLAALDVPPSR